MHFSFICCCCFVVGVTAVGFDGVVEVGVAFVFVVPFGFREVERVNELPFDFLKLLCFGFELIDLMLRVNLLP